MGKSSPKPPPAPDYAAAAQAQGAANLEAARLTARISNPNINTPYGGQRVSFGKPTVNEAAYNKAMEAYNQALAAQKAYNERRAKTPSVGPGQFPTTGPLPTTPGAQPSVGGAVGGPSGLTSPEGFEPQYGGPGKAPQMAEIEPGYQEIRNVQTPNFAARSGDQFAQLGVSDNFQYDPTGGQRIGPSLGGGLLGMQPGTPETAPDYSQFAVQGYSPYVNEKGELVAPTREQFTSMTDLDTPFIEQFLSPEQQKILEAQQRVDLGLAGLGETALGTAQRVIGQPFQPNLRDLQTEIGGYGQVQGAPNLMGMGQAGADVNAYQFGGAPDLFGFGAAGGGPAGGLFGLAQGGPRAPRLRTDVDAGQFAASGATGPLRQQTGIDTSGVANVQYAPDLSRFGTAQGRVPVEQLQRGIDTSQLAAMPVQAGTTGQQAILSRVAPELERRRAALETQLANQGIPRGSEAYNEAITEQQQQENDAIQQAALQGLQLDMAARAQGFGEQQAAAQFANQAALGQFGMGTTAADVYNRALQQNVGTALSQQQAQNVAQQQDFAQRVAAGEFGNAAQQALFGAGMQQAQFGNQAAAQNFAQQMAAQQARNQAAQAQFGMGQESQAARNAALAQNFGQFQAAQQMQNQAVAQNQDAALRAYQALLAGQGQAFGQQMDVQAARNAALAQNQAIAAQQQQLANAAQLQQFNQALQGAQFGNTALQQSLQQQLALRNQPLNEIAALMSGVQVNMPQFQGYQGANVAAAPIFAGTQAAGDFAQRNYQNQVGAYNAQLGLLSGLAGAAGGYFGGR